MAPVEGEEHRLAVGRHGERDVGAVLDAAGAVVHVPALADRHLRLVAPGRQGASGEGEDAVAVGVLEPGAQAPGIPVAGAAELALEAAGGDGDGRADVVGHPVGRGGVVELDGGGVGQGQGDVGAVEGGVGAVAHGPGVVEGGLVLPGAGRNGEDGLPDGVLGVVDEVGEGAVGLPVTGAAELVLEAAGDRHAPRLAWGGRRGGAGPGRSEGARQQQRGREGEQGENGDAVGGASTPRNHDGLLGVRRGVSPLGGGSTASSLRMPPNARRRAAPAGGTEALTVGGAARS